MIIKSLKLHNYRRFHQLDLEFPENLIGITGRNGSGKSTIIEAMGWALYGNRIARTDKEDIRSQFSDSSEACTAELHFACNGHEYRILRQLKGKNAISEAAIYRDGGTEPEAVQERGVNAFVESLLGLDYRSFFASVFAKQKDLAALSSMQPEERRRSINRLINIDRIDKAREQVRRDRNEKRAYVEGLRAGLKNIDELQQEQKNVKALLKEQETQLETAQAEIKQHRVNLDKAKENFNTISEKRQQFVQLQAGLEKLNSRKKDHEELYQHEQTELKEIAEAERQLSEMTPKLQNLDSVKTEKERLDAEALRKSKLDGKLAGKQQLIAAKEREQHRVEELQAKSVSLDSVVSQLQQIDQQIEANESQQQKLHTQVKQTHAQRQSVERAGQEEKQKRDRVVELGPESPCPICTRPLHDHYDKVVAGFEDKIAALRKEYAAAAQTEKKLDGKLHQLENQLQTLRSQRDEVFNKRTAAKEAAGYLQRAQEALQNYQKQEKLLDQEISQIGEVTYDENAHKEIKRQFEELSSLQQQASRLQERAERRAKVKADIARIKAILAETTDEIKRVEEERQGLGFREEDFTRAKEEMDGRTEAFNKSQELLAEMREQVANARKDLERVSCEMEEQKKKREEIKSVEEDMVYLEALDEHLGHFRLELAGRMRPLIAARASELFRITTDTRYSIIELDEDYNIFIYDGNVPYPIARFSGGEQDLTNLCLRIAISQVVAERSGATPINFIVLDEIFGSQDEERKELILNALAQLSSQFRQIFIITHVESIKDVVPVIVSVEVKDEMVSEATMV